MSQSIDWRRVQEFVKSDNTTSFLSLLAEYLQSGNKQFGVLQKGLRTECFQQVGHMRTTSQSSAESLTIIGLPTYHTAFAASGQTRHS